MARNHKLVKAIEYCGRVYKTPTGAARAIAEYQAQKLAKPRYLDCVPRDTWDGNLYWKNVDRIVKRSYPRILRAVTRMMA